MSYDFETGTIYLSAFNSDTFSGQLRTMDKNTGMTTLVYDWGDQIAPFAFETIYCCHPYPGPAANPDPPPGTTDVSINGITLSWENGVNATMVEVWFGPNGNIVKLYDGPLITSWDTGNLQYFTIYVWEIVEKNDTCSHYGPNWGFITEQNPNLHIENYYPQSAQYWTGYTDGIEKYDGEINTIYPNTGWAVYDISTIPESSTVLQEVNFNGYVDSTNWPYWSATPMGSVNPVSANGATIDSQIQLGYAQGVAYIYSDEASGFTTGWHSSPMVNNALPDLQAAVNSGQGYFAMGFVDRDLSTNFFLNFDGWSQPNPPYLEITYLPPVPVELTSFRAETINGIINLTWQTATEENNRVFEVERQESNKQKSVGSQWDKIGFVEGNGTTTEVHIYSFVDRPVISGNYSYRLKQIDFDGTYKYSNVIEVEVDIPLEFSLSQNYPNPFNPSTTINYSIERVGNVNLSVYNILGQKVLNLVNGNMAAGEHQVIFDASGYAGGVYYYKLESGNQLMVKKMILLK